jgi:choice-of-anchor B domain-containing protein
MRFVRTTVLFMLSIILADLLPAQGGSNVQFIGQVRTRGTNGYSQCWGYNAPNGKEYAIIGCNTGTQIVDITSDTLREVAFITGPTSGWREMKVYQHYAYVVTEGNGAGLQIIDLDSMKLVNTITNTQIPSGHTISIEGKFLYINGGRYKSGGIVVLDLNDPVNPKYVGEYQTQYVHDCVIYNDTIYAAAIYGQGLDIIDATNKADIKRVSLTNYPYSGTHNTDVTEDKKYVFTTDEINSNPNNNGNLLRIFDRTDVTNLKLVGTYVARPNTIVHNMHVKGRYGYLAHYSEGVRILDIKYPEIPVEVAHYDTYVGSVNNYVGAWGTFPYFTSNKVIISDISGGLYVIRFAGQNGSVRAARTIVTVLDSVTNLPISDVKVVLPGRFDTLMTDADGKVKFGAVTDTLTATFFKSTYSTGYSTVVRKLAMQFDTVIAVTVKMKQSPSGSLTVNVKNKVTAAPVRNLKVSILNTPVSGLTDVNGAFTVPALLGGNTFTVSVSQWGFLPGTFNVSIVGGTNNPLTIELQPNGVDNFELDLGWKVGSPKDSGATGIWQRAAAVAATVGSDTLQPAKDHSAVGTKHFVTGAASAPTDYVDYLTTLTSPAFDVSGLSDPSLLFWAYFNTRSASKDDTLYVYLTNDLGANWKLAASVSGKQPFWKQFRIDMKSVVAGTDQMQVRFVAKDGGVSSVFDAAVDDVEFGNNLQLSVEKEGELVPSEFALMQNYPNPFNPSTTIRYHVPVRGLVTVKVYDLLGKEAATLVNSEREAGVYSARFDGAGLSSGVYFYTMRAGTFLQTRKLLLTK